MTNPDETIPSSELHILSPDAHAVLNGFKQRRSLCETFVRLDSNLFEIADAEAKEAEAVAKAKPTKETKAEALRKRNTATNHASLVAMHQREIGGLTEIINRCEETEGRLLYVRSECERMAVERHRATGRSSSSTT